MVSAPVWPQKMAALFYHAAALKAARSCPLRANLHRSLAVTDTQIKLGSLRKRAEFLFVRDGRYRAQGGLVIQMRKNPEHDGVRVGFTATKKIGNAVTRNRAKRRLREAARALLPTLGLAGHDYVFIARDGTNARNWQDLLDDAQKALITLSKPDSKNKPKKT